MDSSDNRSNVEQIFGDFKGRRAGIVKAVTTDFEAFFQMCDPEKDNLCLYAHPNGEWEVMLPAEEVPPLIPEPMVGINFAREGMRDKDWLKLVAAYSDAWLLGVVSYLSAKFRLDKADRDRLFNKINDLPTVCEVVTGADEIQHKDKSSAPNRRNGKSKSNSKPVKSSKSEANEEDGDTFCGACEEKYRSDEFWICCDVCEKWFHGKCVKVTPAKALHIKRYKCPQCSTKKKARR